MGGASGLFTGPPTDSFALDSSSERRQGRLRFRGTDHLIDLVPQVGSVTGLVSDERPDAVQSLPLSDLAAFHPGEHNDGHLKLELLRQTSPGRLLVVQDLPGNRSGLQLGSKVRLHDIVRLRLDGPAGRAARLAVQVVHDQTIRERRVWLARRRTSRDSALLAQSFEFLDDSSQLRFQPRGRLQVEGPRDQQDKRRREQRNQTDRYGIFQFHACLPFINVAGRRDTVGRRINHPTVSFPRWPTFSHRFGRGRGFSLAIPRSAPGNRARTW